ncbi:hypothetical protein L1887_53597 [Cichorium endivia]|nr:hypothetical protein L1887_53597 [Cichorium endivia]
MGTLRRGGGLDHPCSGSSSFVPRIVATVAQPQLRQQARDESGVSRCFDAALDSAVHGEKEGVSPYVKPPKAALFRLLLGVEVDPAASAASQYEAILGPDRTSGTQLVVATLHR